VPAPGVALYVLDERLRPVPRGAEGELFIGGAGVARGYLRRAGATAAAFLPDGFAGVAGARMYRTGDLARWNDAGMLEFLGRRDHQVKIRGHRVELGAVESVLRDVPGVRDVAVVPDQDRTGLVGFVAADVDAGAVLRQVADTLPGAMVPTRIVVRDALPRTPTGKVDRAALPSLLDGDDPPSAEAPEAAAPGDVAARIGAAWAEVLKVAHVPDEVNFFDLGGHSLAMFQLQDALERHTGTRPSIVELFLHTTVAAQAALISNGAVRPGTADSREADRRRRAEAVRAKARRTRQEIPR
jgi:acyl carrier protein